MSLKPAGGWAMVSGVDAGWVETGIMAENATSARVGKYKIVTWNHGHGSCAHRKCDVWLGDDVSSGEGWRATVGRCATGRAAGDSDIQHRACCNRCRGLDGIYLGTELCAKQDHLECSSSRTIITNSWLCRRFDCAAACTCDDFCYWIGLCLTTATMLVRGFCGHRCGLGCSLHRASGRHLRTRCQTGSDP